MNNIYTNYNKVFSLLDKIQSDNCYYIISIEGKCGSGKTYLASLIESRYECNIIHMDDFFLCDPQKTNERLKEIGGNVDYERFTKEVITPLVNKKDSFYYYRYNCKLSKLDKKILITKKNINIVEGVYSSHKYFNEHIDFIIFLDIDYDVQLKRILNRNGKEMLERFKNEWIPLENAYFDYYKIKDKAKLYIKHEEQPII